jgi:THO complex subunit 3
MYVHAWAYEMLLSYPHSFLSNNHQSDNLAVLDVRMNRQLKKMKCTNEINEMAWSFNSDHILVTTGGSEMGGIDIMGVTVYTDTAEFMPVTSVMAHTSNCYCLKIDKQFRRMAVGSADFLVSLWNLEDMVCYSTISCLDSPIRCLSFSSSGEYIAAAAEGNNLMICDTQTAQQVVSIDCKSPLMALSWHPEFNLIAIAPDADAAADDSPRYRNADRKQYVQLVSFESLKK